MSSNGTHETVLPSRRTSTRPTENSATLHLVGILHDGFAVSSTFGVPAVGSTSSERLLGSFDGA